MAYQYKEVVVKRCKHCNKEFKTNRKCRRFCCDKCRNQFWVSNFRHIEPKERFE